MSKKKRKSKCDRLWNKKKSEYLKKNDGDTQEWNTEKRAWYCDGKKIIARTQTYSDADEYDTDEQMQQQLNKK